VLAQSDSAAEENALVHKEEHTVRETALNKNSCREKESGVWDLGSKRKLMRELCTKAEGGNGDREIWSAHSCLENG
jgi:hypothetical protein